MINININLARVKALLQPYTHGLLTIRRSLFRPHGVRCQLFSRTPSEFSHKFFRLKKGDFTLEI